jgi:ribosome maturation factor RimP
MGQAEQIRQAADAALVGSGVVVEDVAVHPAGKRRLVRVGVARDVRDLLGDDLSSPVEPLTLDEVAEASRAVGDALDDGDVMGSAPYTLEVTSLGVGHPLASPAQFRRNVGRLLKLRLTEQDSPGAVELEARLTEAGPDGIRLAGDAGIPAPQDLLPYDRITAATVQVEFTRPGGKDN